MDYVIPDREKWPNETNEHYLERQRTKWLRRTEKEKLAEDQLPKDSPIRRPKRKWNE